MQKDELLHLHLLMFQIRLYLEGISNTEIPTERYDVLKITPLHFHKNKQAHAMALLTLGEEIVSHILRQNMPVVNYSPEPAPLALVADAH
jgi:hypothetical protein